MATRCKACGTRTTSSTGYCQSCKSKRHHGYKRLKKENLLLDEAGGAWWIWNLRGDVIVSGKPTREAAILALGGGNIEDEDDCGCAHHATKKPAAQLNREIKDALTEGAFYLTDTHARPLGSATFRSLQAAKGTAMKLVREGVYSRVEVWHRWRGDRYMQGQASDEGWSDV
jgi:hypothetical protein